MRHRSSTDTSSTRRPTAPAACRRGRRCSRRPPWSAARRTSPARPSRASGKVARLSSRCHSCVRVAWWRSWWGLDSLWGERNVSLTHRLLMALRLRRATFKSRRSTNVSAATAYLTDSVARRFRNVVIMPDARRQPFDWRQPRAWPWHSMPAAVVTISCPDAGIHVKIVEITYRYDDTTPLRERARRMRKRRGNASTREAAPSRGSWTTSGRNRNRATNHSGRSPRPRARAGRSQRAQAAPLCGRARLLRRTRADRADLQRRPERPVRGPCGRQRSWRRSPRQPQVRDRPSRRQPEDLRRSRPQRLRRRIGGRRPLPRPAGLSGARRQALAARYPRSARSSSCTRRRSGWRRPMERT